MFILKFKSTFNKNYISTSISAYCSFTFFIEPSNKVYPTTTQPSITIHAAPNPTLSTIMPTKVDPNA